MALASGTRLGPYEIQAPLGAGGMGEVYRSLDQLGDPLADWYRAVGRRIPHVRLVFSNEEAGPAEELLARHLESLVQQALAATPSSS